jgi:D-alanyl-D-alanine carboxypeptidase/D-alanyl-D-alanine-endopeptidase (penicillin-binding protein 4)
VIDANSGKALIDINSEQPMIPASTLKIFTGIAAMDVLGSQTRFETTVKREGNLLTIVGGGDPTLVSQTPENWRGKPPGSEQPPSIDQLSDLAVTAIGQTAETFVVNFDDSLFAEPQAHPTWPDLYVRTGEVAPAQGLTMDFGINDSEAVMKDPAQSVAQYFADALTARGISATLGERKLAGETATVLTSIKSATVTDIVERMITTSNNTMAEFLAHHVGGVSGAFTYDGGASATTQALTTAQIDLTGVTILDGSGLSRSNLASAKSLVSALSYANSSDGAAWANLSGLPVAGISGTLVDRYELGEPGRGTVRAKTGTLSKVVALSGTLVDASGDLLIFTFIANDVPSIPKQGAAALDEVVKALAQCGCRTP